MPPIRSLGCQVFVYHSDVIVCVVGCYLTHPAGILSREEYCCNAVQITAVRHIADGCVCANSVLCCAAVCTTTAVLCAVLLLTNVRSSRVAEQGYATRKCNRLSNSKTCEVDERQTR